MWLHLDDNLKLLRWTYKVLQPFLVLRESLNFPFPRGDSPIDFLSAPSRAGRLYVDLSWTAEELVLLWIRRAKDFVVAGDFPLQLCVVFTVNYLT